MYVHHRPRWPVELWSDVSKRYGLPRWYSGKEETAKQEMQEMWVQSLCQEDLLEEEMATHSSILTWRIPWTEKPGRLQFMESQRHHQ